MNLEKKRVCFSDISFISFERKPTEISNEERSISDKTSLTTCVDSINEAFSTRCVIDNLYEKHLDPNFKFICAQDGGKDIYLSTLEFNWEDHGYYILHNLCPDMINLLNKYFNLRIATDIRGEEICSNSDLEPIPNHLIISNYVEKLLGLTHDYFNYSTVNKLLDNNLRKYIKAIVFYPSIIEKQEVADINYNTSTNKNNILSILLLTLLTKMKTQLLFFTNRLYELIKQME